MRNETLLAVGVLCAGLAACGPSEPEPVVEQIVVREPGDPAVGAGAPTLSEGAGEVDLVALGERAFQACTGCHNADPGGASMAGPNLHGVMGRAAGSRDDFAYSEALASSGITWDFATLDRYLANPTGYVEGTAMVAGAVRDGETRAAIAAYLASTSE
ncbi:MAG: c-type cytochrome [Erythrobacter sp.]|uniref:c-type cytochrome n=1 Tax=Erythrobacter sp. TaxID=1042 RepID=UPI00261405EB|nr:c-type cytochrome [Erythrobacter sp.]MDJ0979645.1 c-type cytochrome [Erythrobacter sp.]